MDNVATCQIIDCGNPIKRSGFCYGHYMKNWRYGTPTPDHPPRWKDLTGRRFGSLVVRGRDGTGWRCECDCGAEATVRTGDLNRGSAYTCGNRARHRRRDDITYGAAHARVRFDRGPADNFSCVDCGVTAQHWSYDHKDTAERFDSAVDAPYSVDPAHYEPRCVSCHKQFDLSRLMG